MTHFLRLFWMVIACLSALTVSAASHPNIVFILVDDLRADALGYAGHPFVRTPNIDRLAREGGQFKNFFVTTPLCSPSRASFLTGQYAHTHGVRGNADATALSHQLVTFPRLLQEAGYETAYVGKWHMGTDASRRPGFDYWVCLPGQGAFIDPRMNINGTETRVEGYCTDILNDHAVKFLDRKHEKPFALYLSHKAVHGPFTPAPRHQNLYLDQPIKGSPNVNASLEGKPALTREVPGEAARRARAASGTRTPPERTIRAQLQCVASIDEGVGRVLAALEKQGQLDRTMVVFTSDNGFFWGEHGLGDKRWAYEESIRCPLAIRYPPLIKAGTVFEQLTLNIDLAPTFLELGGVPVPASVEGRSLVPLFKKPKSKGRESIFTEYFQEKAYPRMPDWQSIRTADWKYIHYQNLPGMDELYNLREDPYEMKNRIHDPRARKVLARLQAELQKTR